jgi:hypothetical protein
MLFSFLRLILDILLKILIGLGKLLILRGGEDESEEMGK